MAKKKEKYTGKRFKCANKFILRNQEEVLIPGCVSTINEKRQTKKTAKTLRKEAERESLVADRAWGDKHAAWRSEFMAIARRCASSGQAFHGRDASTTASDLVATANGSEFEEIDDKYVAVQAACAVKMFNGLIVADDE